MLERARKEVEVATGLSRELSSVNPEMATEVRLLKVHRSESMVALGRGSLPLFQPAHLAFFADTQSCDYVGLLNDMAKERPATRWGAVAPDCRIRQEHPPSQTVCAPHAPRAFSDQRTRYVEKLL